MKNSLFVLILAAILMMPTIASANSYFAADYSIVKFDQKSMAEAKLKSLIARFGFAISGATALEFRIASELENEKASVAGKDVRLRMKDLYGLYLNMRLLGGLNRVYGVLGYTWLDMQMSGVGISDSNSGEDWSYGLGFEHDFAGGSTGSAFYLEYMRYYRKSSARVDALSAGVKFNL